MGRNIQSLKLSKILNQDSISKIENSKPFWNNSLIQVYQKIWQPNNSIPLICKKKESLSYNLNVSNDLLEMPRNISWHSLKFNHPKINYPSDVQYSQKLRIYPNHEQVLLFNKCLGASRFFYNKSVSKIQEHLDRRDYSILNKKSLRPIVMKSDKTIEKGDKMEWQKDIPYDTRQEAIADACSAYKSAFSNLRNGNIKQFNVSFKSKRLKYLKLIVMHLILMKYQFLKTD
jgi:hypothetical protein